jgi:hypothetical protein
VQAGGLGPARLGELLVHGDPLLRGHRPVGGHGDASAADRDHVPEPQRDVGGDQLVHGLDGDLGQPFEHPGGEEVRGGQALEGVLRRPPQVAQPRADGLGELAAGAQRHAQRGAAVELRLRERPEDARERERVALAGAGGDLERGRRGAGADELAAQRDHGGGRQRRQVEGGDAGEGGAPQVLAQGQHDPQRGAAGPAEQVAEDLLALRVQPFGVVDEDQQRFPQRLVQRGVQAPREAEGGGLLVLGHDRAQVRALQLVDGAEDGEQARAGPLLLPRVRGDDHRGGLHGVRDGAQERGAPGAALTDDQASAPEPPLEPLEDLRQLAPPADELCHPTPLTSSAAGRPPSGRRGRTATPSAAGSSFPATVSTGSAARGRSAEEVRIASLRLRVLRERRHIPPPLPPCGAVLR